MHFGLRLLLAALSGSKVTNPDPPAAGRPHREPDPTTPRVAGAPSPTNQACRLSTTWRCPPGSVDQLHGDLRRCIGSDRAPYLIRTCSRFWMEEGYVTPPCPCPSNQAKCDERSAGNDQTEPQGEVGGLT